MEISTILAFLGAFGASVALMTSLYRVYRKIRAERALVLVLKGKLENNHLDPSTLESPEELETARLLIEKEVTNLVDRDKRQILDPLNQVTRAGQKAYIQKIFFATAAQSKREQKLSA